ncbi:hypothetical protein DIPPA_16931 [Diplonema papillatum]|nr:hypothetical protein DIPPA_16931 [Diplonema papillatum]|eukprot:gene22120-33938_t
MAWGSDLLAVGALVMIGVVYTGFGFLMKGVVDDPYSAIPGVAVAALVQYVALARFVGRRKRRGKKHLPWTRKALAARYVPLVLSTSLLAGIASNVGKTAVMHLSIVDPLQRRLLKYAATAVAGAVPGKMLLDVIEQECLPLDPVAEQLPADSAAKKTIKAD